MNIIGHSFSHPTQLNSTSNQQEVDATDPALLQRFNDVPVNRPSAYQAAVNLIKTDIGRLVGVIAAIHFPRDRG